VPKFLIRCFSPYSRGEPVNRGLKELSEISDLRDFPSH
jgi:hypothetical protein